MRHRRSAQDDVSSEIEFHIEMRAREYMDAGLSADEARLAARRAFGDAEPIAAAYIRSARQRQQPGGRDVMRSVLNDVRFAIRTLRRSPGFAAIALITLALGIGATSAMFSVADGILFKPLPLTDANRLVTVWWTNPQVHDSHFYSSYPDSLDWAASPALESVGRQSFGRQTMTQAGMPIRALRSINVDPGFFNTLKVRPALGRLLAPADQDAGAPRVAVIGDRLWQTVFGGDPQVAGKVLNLASGPVEVIGVLPPGFDYPSRSELWMPIAAASTTSRGSRMFAVVARVANGVTPAQAQSDIDRIARQIGHDDPTAAKWQARVVGLQESIVGDLRNGLWLLFGTVGLVLLIACGNIASLLMARATARRREVAVRTSLGAARGRIVRQLLTEGFVLAIAGSLLGLGLASAMVRTALALLPPAIPHVADIAIDWRVSAFALAAAAVSTLVFSLLPALQLSGVNMATAMREGAPGAGDPRRHRAGRVLVTLEVAASMVLLIGAGLLVRSLLSLTAIDPGYDLRRVVVVDVANVAPRASRVASSLFYGEAMDRLRQLPGVRRVGATDALPLYSGFTRGTVTRDDGALPPVSNVDLRTIADDYLEAMGIRVTAGRVFDSAERASGDACLINGVAASLLWPGTPALGHTLAFPGGRSMVVVGVVANVRHSSLESQPVPEVYEAFTPSAAGSLVMVVATDRDPETLVAEAHRAMDTLPGMPNVIRVSSMSDIAGDSLIVEKFRAWLVSSIAGLAGLLAIVGVFGLTACLVSDRTREIGIRIALGSRRAEVVSLMLRQSAWPIVIGIAVGLSVGLVTSSVLRAFLFDVAPTDGPTFAAVSLLFLLVAMVAVYLPSRRAASVDPANTLRRE